MNRPASIFANPATHPRRMRPILATAIAALVWAGPASPGLMANDIVGWNEAMLDAIRLDNSAPTLAARNLAMLNTAMHDAVNSIHPRYQPYARDFKVEGPCSETAAIAEVGRRIIAALYPGSQAAGQQLAAAMIATVPPGAARDAGIALGAAAASHILELRRSDGSSTDYPYIPGTDPGEWRRTPPFFRPPVAPGWRYVTPFAIDSAAAFTPPPPPPLGSPAYAAALEEVRVLGSIDSVARTPYQTETAHFWSDFSYTATPPGHWIEIACGIIRAEGMTIPDSARILALLGLSIADAGIVSWEGKYRYNLWRPITAIQRADLDSNPSTEPDPDWDNLLSSPPFPSYPSGHSTFSQAAASTLSAVLGRDDVTFDAVSDSIPGAVRRYTSFDACAAEIGLSRIYGGIHYGFDNTEGKKSGKRVAAHVTSNWLLPLDSLPRATTEIRADGIVRLRVHGAPGTRLRVRRASALDGVWQTMEDVDAIPGGALITFGAAAEEAGFYRVEPVSP